MKDKIKKLNKLASDIYNVSLILFEYCKKQDDCEELIKICPILDLLNQKADDLYFKMSEIK